MRKILTLLIMASLCIVSQAATSFYLTGSFNGWKPDQSQYRFAESNGIYTLRVSSLSGDFKVTTSDWSQQYGCDSPLEYGKTYKCVLASNGHNMTLSEGTGNDILITFDLANRTVRVDGRPTLYLVGEFNNWMPTSVYAFQYKDGAYTLSAPDFNGFFRVTSRDGSIALGNALPTIPLNGNYVLQKNGNNMHFGGLNDNGRRIKITVIPDFNGEYSGVDDILDENVENAGMTVYYNLQGFRVEDPGKGIYIRRCGSKSEKVIIR